MVSKTTFVRTTRSALHEDENEAEYFGFKAHVVDLEDLTFLQISIGLYATCL